MFNFLRCTKEKALARELVRRLVRDIPAKFMQDTTKQLSVNKITRSLEKIYQFAGAELSVSGKLGLYRRSVLANTFKWGLKEEGYSTGFIDLATEGLLVELGRIDRSTMA